MRSQIHLWADDRWSGPNYRDHVVPTVAKPILDDRVVRVIFASAATIVAIGTILTRDEPAVDYSLVAPIVVVYWAWALIDSFPAFLVYMLGLPIPLVLNIIESGEEISMFIVVVTIAMLASREPNRVLVKVILALTLFLILLFPAVDVIDQMAWQNWFFGILFSWGAGEIVYRYTMVIDELEQTRSLVADQAALHERRRIARDVHDLVGHSLSVVMLHITGARVLVRKDPDEAERALEQAEAAGRESLAEIRRTVGLLRDDIDGHGSALPSPDLTDIADLVDEFLVAGLSISFDAQGPLAQVEATTALAGYRIVQEALTNASRHTLEAQVTATVNVTGASIELAVHNSGGHAIEGRTGSGFGLVSMRERARSVGGSLVAGPTANGWMVEASLPLVAVSASQ